MEPSNAEILKRGSAAQPAITRTWRMDRATNVRELPKLDQTTRSDKDAARLELVQIGPVRFRTGRFRTLSADLSTYTSPLAPCDT